MIRQTFPGADGFTLAYHELGTGRPVVLLHGYTSTGPEAWVSTGIADRLAADDRRVIMPDFRGHGGSAQPRDPQAYPPDVLTRDAEALIAHLALSDYDLGGYSLGGRIVARMLALGVRPGRAVVAGTGLEPIIHAAGRGERYRRILSNLGTFAPGSFEAQVEEHLVSTGADPVALLHVLNTFVDTPLEALAEIDVPTLVIAGDADLDRGSLADLAAAIPGSRLRLVPGDHITALTSSELSDEIAGFIGGEAAG